MQDLRLAIRSLRASPTVTCVVVASLALVSVPTRRSSRWSTRCCFVCCQCTSRVGYCLVSTPAGSRSAQFSYATFAQIRDHGRCLRRRAGYTACCGKSIVGDSGHPRREVDGVRHWRLFFNARSRAPIAAGCSRQPMTPPLRADGPVVVVSYRYGARSSRDPRAAIDTPLTIDGTLAAIVGVMPPEFSASMSAIRSTSSRPSTSPPRLDGVRRSTMHGVAARHGARSDAGSTSPPPPPALRAAQAQSRAAAMPKTSSQRQVPAGHLHRPRCDGRVGAPPATSSSRSSRSLASSRSCSSSRARTSPTCCSRADRAAS